MITYDAVLAELEKHLNEAKLATNEQQFREALVATKALCDVVLQLPTNIDKQATFQSKATHVSNELLRQQAVAVRPIESQPFSTLNRLEEEDGANGESIFDF